MKFIETAIVFDRGDLTHTSTGWAKAHEAYSNVIRSMVNPEGASTFRLKPKRRKAGSKTKWDRNGVGPIKEQFQQRMIAAGWKPEEPLSLDQKIQEEGKREPWLIYPGKTAITQELHQQVGELDFWIKSENERVGIEWETGNISSSHRSMNKLCLALRFGLLDVCVLVVPSLAMYRHLTDRIGNWKELGPYLAFWREFGRGVERGLLVITTVEHDQLDDSIEYLRIGEDGRSAEGKENLRKEREGLF